MSTSLEGHTLRHFDGELYQLHIELLRMARIVFSQLQMALDSFQRQDPEDARAMNEVEYQVNSLEKRIDSAIAEVLAKRCPVARDLRVIMAFSKGVTDLERIGDEAARVARISMNIYHNEHSNPGSYLLHDIAVMGKLASASLKEAIGILEVLDQNRATKFLSSHNELNEEFSASLRRLTTYVLEDTRNMGHVFNIVLILKSLERIGDYARNLAEYVVYMVSGEDIRHIESGEA
ncbi:phosphate signaling complex protein PhoU [Nitrosomonas sp.]|uniref:phosphate signaling complex protein PhoU n=1 Tax=Nitrosomonas sp. TaxID=42353 RepID=UPI002087E02B|nr:phosphate signaling complex protein PhoU [Nitrosomonas sp.]GJL76100.1 MAG: phosphate transport system regulatory protein PhoU [Nitrosomonas sp.]